MIYIIHGTHDQVSAQLQPIKYNLKPPYKQKVFPLHHTNSMSTPSADQDPPFPAQPSKQSSSTRLKNQIDAILQNDLSVLARHPDTPHRALLTTHNNPLIMRYVKNVYNEYRIEDPLPSRYAKYKATFEEKDVPEQPQTLKKKEHHHCKDREEGTKRKKKIQISKNIRASLEGMKADKNEKERAEGFESDVRDFDSTEKKEDHYTRLNERLKTQYKNKQQDSLEKEEYQSHSLSNHKLVTPNNHPHLHLEPAQPLLATPRRKLNFSYYVPPSANQKTLPTNHTQQEYRSQEKEKEIGSQTILKEDIKQSVNLKASNCYFESPHKNKCTDYKQQMIHHLHKQKPAVKFVIGKQPQSPPWQAPLTSQQKPVTSIILAATPPPPPLRTASPKQRSISQPKTTIHQSSLNDHSHFEHESKKGDGAEKSNRRGNESRTLGVRKIQQQGERQIKVNWVGTKALPHIITFKNPLRSDEESLPAPDIPESPQFSGQPQTIEKSSQNSQMKEIPESFKYCIGCEQALLQVNIPFHQQKCQEFKYLATLPPNEIIGYLKTKISKFQDSIQQYSSELLETDPQNISFHSSKMLEESRAIVEDGHFNQKYSEEYEEALVVSRKWMRMSEEISKVNWFLKVREGIRKQMNI